MLFRSREIRLKFAYYVTCTRVIKDADGEVTELRCTYDPATRGGNAPDGRKVKATIHWVAAKQSIAAEVRLYETLFEPGVEIGDDIGKAINPKSLEVLTDCRGEPDLSNASDGEALQFERQGYFCKDPDSKPGRLVFNRTIRLRDSWAKVQAKG